MCDWTRETHIPHYRLETIFNEYLQKMKSSNMDFFCKPTYFFVLKRLPVSITAKLCDIDLPAFIEESYHLLNFNNPPNITFTPYFLQYLARAFYSFWTVADLHNNSYDEMFEKGIQFLIKEHNQAECLTLALAIRYPSANIVRKNVESLLSYLAVLKTRPLDLPEQQHCHTGQISVGIVLDGLVGCIVSFFFVPHGSDMYSIPFLRSMI